MTRMLSPIKDSLLSAMKNQSMRKKYKEHSVKYYWRDIVGADVARHVSCGSFSRGTLTVHADSSVWSHQILMKKNTLIRQINEFAGDKIVKDIRIQTGYQPNFREINKDLPNLDYYLDQITLDGSVKKEIEEKVSRIKDDALKRKMKSVLEKQKKLEQLKRAHGYHPCEECGSLCEKNETYCISCRRQKRKDKRQRIRRILLDAPFLTYAQLDQLQPCTNVEYQEEKADLIDLMARKLKSGDDSEMTKYLLTMLVTGMTPDVIKDETVAKIVLKFRGKKYVSTSGK